MVRILSWHSPSEMFVVTDVYRDARVTKGDNKLVPFFGVRGFFHHGCPSRRIIHRKAISPVRNATWIELSALTPPLRARMYWLISARMISPLVVREAHCSIAITSRPSSLPYTLPLTPAGVNSGLVNSTAAEGAASARV